MENIEDTYPLSPMQQGMLFHSLYAPQSGVYVLQLICTLPESLNASAFKRAWERVVARHPVFRTSFRWEGLAEPLQEVHRHVAVPWEEQDWRTSSAIEQERRLACFLEADRRRGFEFDEAPLMRLALFRVAEASWKFIWTCHHAILDGGSILLILKELFAFYEAFCQGQDLPLRQPRPYRDYIDWLGKQDSAKSESFWRPLLEGFTAPTPLIAGRGYRTETNEEKGYGKQEIRLSETVTSALESLARLHQLTLNTLLTGAWALLLSRYSGEEDVVFGTTRASRHTTVEGAGSMVGLFINTLPLRVHVLPELKVLPWLKELRYQWTAVREYEHTPLVKVQGWSEVPAGQPLFESLVIFENYQLNSALRVQGGSWENREFRLLGMTNYPLAVTGYSAPELLLEIAYDRSRFDDGAISRMLGHLRTLLEGMVTNPQARLSDLPLLTPAEQHQLVVEWNDTKRDYPKDKCIHQLFEAQVKRTPDAIAVVFPSTGTGRGEDKGLTYRELNRKANQLAHYLKRLGVGPEGLVGICMERSLEMVVGLLGILKAGGAYVPLDPDYPKERLAFMLEDSRAAVLLTQKNLAEVFPEHRARVVCLDADWEVIEREDKEQPTNGTTPENLAYVIYTSGSTGKPKGVRILHRAAVNFLNSMREEPGLSDQDTLLAVTTLSFDIAALELFLPLTVGARVVIVSREVAADGVRLSEELAKCGATAMQATPTTWRLLLEAGWQGGNHLKALCGGEALPRELATQLLARSSSLWNLYGPTETTIWSALHRVESTDRPIPVGRPIANTQVYILDSDLQPVPIGIPGELHIGGFGLARGYWNRPELTAEKFIPNPFSQERSARLYKTGDLARYLPDGNIEFLGRIDHQVKIRGFRIEPGEVETVLGQHPSVQQVIVLAREDVPGEKRLVAYVVPHREQALTTNDLRSFLKSTLPDHMVPTAFVMLEALPLTPNGKVDRRALPAPDQSRPELESRFVAPRTPVEEALARIWAEVIKLERVGVHDNFFDLGGHSLLATQVISRVRDAFQVELSLRSLFETPTVAGLAEVLQKAMDSRAESPAPKISRGFREFGRVKLSS